MRERFEENLLSLCNIRGAQEPQVQNFSGISGRLWWEDQRPSDYKVKKICKILLIEKLDKKFKEWEQHGTFGLKINERKDFLTK